MNENKFNYILGVGLVVLLVLVVYLGGRVKNLESDVVDLSGRVDGLELSSLSPDFLSEEPSFDIGSEDLQGSAYNALDDYYYGDYYSY